MSQYSGYIVFPDESYPISSKAHKKHTNKLDAGLEECKLSNMRMDEAEAARILTSIIAKPIDIQELLMLIKKYFKN